MNIESSIPQGWSLGYIIKTISKYECQMENNSNSGHTFYTLGNTPTEAFTRACDKAREYNIRKLMEECMAREDDVGVEATKPCRSPYCECDVGKCTHPGFHDARGE